MVENVCWWHTSHTVNSQYPTDVNWMIGLGHDTTNSLTHSYPCSLAVFQFNTLIFSEINLCIVNGAHMLWICLYFVWFLYSSFQLESSLSLI